jgi:glycosyltransferase involved in cell wall biosynthesis
MFPQSIRALIDNPKRRHEIGKAAWRHARERLDWSLQAARLRHILERQVLGRTRPRLLVITYRYTDPPLGGAEVHLLELLRQLDRRGSFTIDVATLDIVTIHNRFHFSCRYARDANALLPGGLAAVDVRRFPVDEIDDESALVAGRTLFAAWSQERRQISLRHLHLYDKPILLGGWYYPERTADGTEVWSSGKAWLFVGSAERIIVRGISFRRRHLRVRGANAVLLDAVVDGQFELEVATAGDEAIAFEMETIEVPDDPRALGFRLRSIDLQLGDRTEKLALGVDFRSLLRTRHPQLWIDELIATARARDQQHDELFQRARGPNSTALEHWLAGNIAQYDVVIGHSVPFRTCVSAAQHALGAGVPLVQIPDFHVDDEFYHWRSYYDALAAASTNITFPRAATALFYERIGARSVYLPHGVDPREQPDSAGRAAFEKLRSCARPYVLILGRKDRAKNYDAIIDAVDSINAQSRSVDVVMIGRDEDGVRLDPSRVTFVGPQPRPVVVAAIAGALCVISMSDSESFGIVILEAWAQRTPVIVSADCHAYTELVEDGVDGLHALRETLADKIRFLHANAEIAKAMGERGRAKALRSYSWGSIAEQLDALLLNFATQSPAHLRRSAA